MPLVSVITVTYNRAATLVDTIHSVLAQTYSNIEYIVIDGGSTDDTLELLRSNDHSIDYWMSEPDTGIYDAINKGIRTARGEYIGLLNSDDYFSSNESVAAIVSTLRSGSFDAVHGDLKIVSRKDTTHVQRYYRLNGFKPGHLRYGIIPAHPTFYCKRSLYEKVGPYKTDYRVSADSEMMIRTIIRASAKLGYVDRDLVTMRSGGISNNGMLGRIHQNFEIVRACRENGLYTNIVLLIAKIPLKLMQYLRRQQ
ncbi:MAG: glycosyltransferase [Gammaproteobacteria bacterium]|nr:glycosyltransferase [Gammaproteobacteria bacterium]